MLLCLTVLSLCLTVLHCALTVLLPCLTVLSLCSYRASLCSYCASLSSYCASLCLAAQVSVASIRTPSRGSVVEEVWPQSPFGKSMNANEFNLLTMRRTARQPWVRECDTCSVCGSETALCVVSGGHSLCCGFLLLSFVIICFVFVLYCCFLLLAICLPCMLSICPIPLQHLAVKL